MDWTKEVFRVRKEERDIAAGKYIIDAVREGLAPFRPTEVTLEIVQGFGLDLAYERLVIRIRNMPSLVITIPLDRELFVAYPEDAYHIFAAQVWEEIKNLPRIAPPDNIGLGEE